MSVFLQPIYTQTVGSGGVYGVTFNSIPQTFTDLMVVASTRSSTSETKLAAVFNNDTSSNYSLTELTGNGSSISTARQSNGTYWINMGGIVPSSYTANTFSNNSMYIPNYRSSNFKQFIIDGVLENNATATGFFLVANLWRNTSAISTIYITGQGGNLVQYSTFTLYGITRG
jgi:hypothetical protein